MLVRLPGNSVRFSSRETGPTGYRRSVYYRKAVVIEIGPYCHEDQEVPQHIICKLEESRQVHGVIQSKAKGLKTRAADGMTPILRLEGLDLEGASDVGTGIQGDLGPRSQVSEGRRDEEEKRICPFLPLTLLMFPTG